MKTDADRLAWLRRSLVSAYRYARTAEDWRRCVKQLIWATAKFRRDRMNVKHCSGCRNNFYNGNNPMGIKECWSLKSAKLVKRIVIPVDLAPPYKIKPKTLPDCYHMERFVCVKPENIRKDGYWA